MDANYKVLGYDYFIPVQSADDTGYLPVPIEKA